MKLVFTEKLNPSTDAFGAMIYEGDLYVPLRLKKACGTNVIKDAERLLSTMHSFPTSFCTALEWTRPQFDRALKGFIGLLEGKVREVFLRPPPPPDVALGARPPEHHPIQIGHVVEIDEDREE
jgi:hypothetical protein